MKSLKLNVALFAIFAMIFTSCSKEETGIPNQDPDKASLSFGALLTDLTSDRAATKGHLDFLDGVPECSEGTAAYVEIILSRDGVNVVGDDGDAYRVDLVAGKMFTEEDTELELTPGNYSLDYFAVFTAAGTRIWLAPMGGGDDDNLSNFVDNPLPIAIDLRAGVKKYVEVDVLCYDDRFVNEYGYLFFEIDENEALEFCIFANYCNSDGRHYPARYSVDIWAGTDATGDQLYNDLENAVSTNEDGDFYATPLCVALPSNEDMNADYLYYEITLLDWAENYGDVDQATNVLSGTLNRADIESNFGEDDEVEYEHFRFGCGDDTTPPDDEDADMDGVPDSIDDCENTPAGTNVNSVGCPEQTDGDADGDGVPDSTDECENTPAGTNVDGVGCPVTTTCDETNPTADCDGDSILNKCDEDNANYSSFDCDNDGFVNSVDNCDNTPGVAGGEGGDGCPVETDPCAGLPAVCDVDFGTLGPDCYISVLDGADNDGYILVEGPGTFDIIQTVIGEDWGDVIVSINNSGSVTLSIDGGLPSDKITAYEIAVVKSDNGTMSSTCRESECDSSVEEVTGDQPAIQLTFDALDYTYPFYLRVNTVICESVVGE